MNERVYETSNYLARCGQAATLLNYLLGVGAKVIYCSPIKKKSVMTQCSLRSFFHLGGGTCSVRQVGYCNLRSGWSKGQGGIDQRSGGMIDHIRREREGGEGSNCVNNSIQFRRG